MQPSYLNRFPFPAVLCAVGLSLTAVAGLASAQDVKLNVTYVCNGEREYIESCNIRDTSDTSTCQVAHPDRPQHNGFMAYTSETRGALKKLLPTCTQPTAQDLAKADAFQKKQQEILNQNIQKANPQMARASGAGSAESACRLRYAHAAEKCGRACHAPLRFFRPAACKLHRQPVAGSFQLDDLVGAADRQ